MSSLTDSIPVADGLDISESTVERLWQKARAFLFDALQ